MKFTHKAALMAAGLMATVGCGANVATQSNRYTVQQKIHTGMYWEPIGSPATPGKVDHYDYHPEAWELHLKNTDGSEIDLKVSKTRYDRTKVGDRLVF